MSAAVLKARSAILGDLQENDFVDVACGSGPLVMNTYALSKSGKLCLFDNRRMLEKFTEVKVRKRDVQLCIFADNRNAVVGTRKNLSPFRRLQPAV